VVGAVLSALGLLLFVVELARRAFA